MSGNSGTNTTSNSHLETSKEVLANESKTEPEAEAVFASMDVREKIKIIEQAKTKTLGDFLIPSRVSQGQLKKKKKKQRNAVAAAVEDGRLGAAEDSTGMWAYWVDENLNMYIETFFQLDLRWTLNNN